MKRILLCIACLFALTFVSSRAAIIEVAPAGAWGVLGISGGVTAAGGEPVLLVGDNTVQTNDLFEGQGRTAMNQVNSLYPGVIDKSFLMLAVGLSIIALVLAALVRVHPVFLIAFLLVLGFIIFFCSIFSNIYNEMASSPEFVDLAEQLTMINKVMLTLPFIVGILGGLLAIIMYKNWSVG